MLQSCGAAAVGWQGEHSSMDEDDEKITHQILDRPISGQAEQSSVIEMIYIQ